MSKNVRVPAVCVHCRKDFMARKDSKGLFCSVSCSGTHHGGSNHYLYNGGLSEDVAEGRWKIMCRDGTQMWFYRGVMAAKVGRLLDPSELVHHIDEDPSNDDPDNLEITTRPLHIEMHREALLAGRS